MYWSGGHGYMITGIKAQYSKLKDNYDKVCKECDSLKKKM